MADTIESASHACRRRRRGHQRAPQQEEEGTAATAPGYRSRPTTLSARASAMQPRRRPPPLQGSPSACRPAGPPPPGLSSRTPRRNRSRPPGIRRRRLRPAGCVRTRRPAIWRGVMPLEMRSCCCTLNAPLSTSAPPESGAAAARVTASATQRSPGGQAPDEASVVLDGCHARPDALNAER